MAEPSAVPDPAEREALELALRSELYDDEACSAAQLVVREGWRPPGEVAALVAERNTALRALREAAIPLEVLAAQITANPYRELTDGFQQQIVGAAHTVRAALLGGAGVAEGGET